VFSCFHLSFFVAAIVARNRLNKMLQEWQWEEAHEYNEASSDGEGDDESGAGEEALWDFLPVPGAI